VVTLAQCVHLRGVDPEEREHAALSRDETEVMLRAMHAQLLHDLESQVLDAAAHGLELLRPLPPQRLIAQDRVHDGRAVIGRHRPDAARDAHQLTECGVRRCRRCADQVQQAGALAIQSEVLRARHRAQHLRQLGAEQPRPEGIGVGAFAESLVGHVDERHQLAALHQREQLAPLRWREIGPRGVVTGGMQQHHGACRQPLERRGHRLELHPTGGRVEVRIALELEAAAREERRVVRPRGRAHVHHGVRGGRADQLRAEAQRSTAARRLYAADPARGERRMRGPEHQLLHGLVESGIARRADVRLGRLAREHRGLGTAHRIGHRGVAVRVTIDTDAEVDLVRIRVGAKRRHEPENGVGNNRGKMLEHVCLRR